MARDSVSALHGWTSVLILALSPPAGCHHFVKLTFYVEHRALDGELWFTINMRDTTIVFMIQGCWRKYTHGTHQGATQGGQGRVQTEDEIGPGAYSFVRTHGWSVIQTKRLGCSRRVLTKGPIRHRTRRQKRLDHKGPWGGHARN